MPRVYDYRPSILATNARDERQGDTSQGDEDDDDDEEEEEEEAAVSGEASVLGSAAGVRGQYLLHK